MGWVTCKTRSKGPFYYGVIGTSISFGADRAVNVTCLHCYDVVVDVCVVVGSEYRRLVAKWSDHEITYIPDNGGQPRGTQTQSQTSSFETLATIFHFMTPSQTKPNMTLASLP